MTQENNPANPWETPETPGAAEFSTEEVRSGAHVGDIPLEGETLGPDDPGPVDDAWAGLTDGDGFLTKDAWIELFGKAHQLPGHALQLQTLIAAPDLPATKEAGAAIYDICRETPALHWMIKPGSQWFQRIAAIGIWGGTLYMGCAYELAERRQARRAAAGETPKGDAPPAGDYAEDRARAQEAQGNAVAA